MTERRFSLTARIVVGFTLGLLVGVIAGPRIAPLGEAGKVIIGLVKILAGPFLFFAILSSVLTSALSWRQARVLLGVTSINAVCALTIGLGLSMLFTPGETLAAMVKGGLVPNGKPWQAPTFDGNAVLKSLMPKSVFEAFTENSILALALSAVVFGLALRSVLHGLERDRRDRLLPIVDDTVELGRHVFQKILAWAVELAPFAVFAVVAKAVGEKGLASLGGLWAYLVVGAAGLLLQMGLVYLSWVRWAGVPIGTFWRVARKPMMYSVGTNSSLATLPLTLDALDELKVSRQASTLGACVGTNLNNDGILLYEAMAVLFVAQAYGIPLGLGTKLLVVGLCWVATIGIGGVPEAGFVSLSIILTQLEMPLELLPFLLSVDWLLARLRSVTNVCSDIVTSLVIDRWLAKGLAKA